MTTLTAKIIVIVYREIFDNISVFVLGLSKMAEEIASGGEKSCSSNKDCPDEGFQCVQLGEVGMCECGSYFIFIEYSV